MAYDVFISYRHTQMDTALKLEAELKSRGLNVFRDESEIATFESISDRVAQGLANSRMCVVVASENYGESRACMWELTAAYITAKRDPIGFRRLCLLNPGIKPENLPFLPADLRDRSWADTPEKAAVALAETLKEVDGVFGSLAGMGFTQPFGTTITSSERFTGRASTFWKIHGNMNLAGFPMSGGGAGPGIAQLTGFGGTGKTLLAQEYALRFSAAYPGGIFWLKAHGSYNPDLEDISGFRARRLEEFKKAAAQLGWQLDEQIEFNVLRRLIAERLKADSKAALWVVDDMPMGLTEKGHAEEAHLWLAPHTNARTLLTSRSREYRNFGGHIPLDQLEEQEALDLLKANGIDVDSQKEAVEGLVERLGRHAMALDIAGGQIVDEPISVRPYLERINTHSDELIDPPPELISALPTDCATSIVTAIDRSIVRLSDPPKDFLRLASHLSPSPIKETFLKNIFMRVDALPENEAEKRARRAFQGSDKYSLTKPVEASRTVHALIGDVMRYKGYADDERGKAIRMAAIDALYDILDHTKDHSYIQSIADEVEHARHLTREVGGEGPEYKLLIRIAGFDHFRGYAALATEDWSRVLELREKVLGPEHPDTLLSMNNLASTLRAMGYHKGAKELFEKVLEKRKTIFPPDHLDTLLSMNNLAATLQAMGDHEGAKELQVEVLEKREAILGPDNPDTLASMNNLAETLRAMGDLNGAKVLHVEVLEKRKTILGPDHPDTLTSMNNLASTLWKMGDHKGAKDLLDEVLEKRKVILGPDHPNTFSSMNNLASTLGAMGDHHGAKVLQVQVLGKRKAILGPEHPNTLTSMNNLAETLRAMGDHKGAKVLQVEVLEKRKAILGLDHPDTLTSMNNLAMTLDALGDFWGARKLLREALERSKIVLGPDHPTTLAFIKNFKGLATN